MMSVYVGDYNLLDWISMGLPVQVPSLDEIQRCVRKGISVEPPMQNSES